MATPAVHWFNSLTVWTFTGLFVVQCFHSLFQDRVETLRPVSCNSLTADCGSRVFYLKFIVSDDDQLLGPLPETLLPQEEGADATVSDRPVSGVLGRPSASLVPPLAVWVVVLLVGLVGAAQSV